MELWPFSGKRSSMTSGIFFYSSNIRPQIAPMQLEVCQMFPILSSTCFLIHLSKPDSYTTSESKDYQYSHLFLNVNVCKLLYFLMNVTLLWVFGGGQFVITYSKYIELSHRSIVYLLFFESIKQTNRFKQLTFSLIFGMFLNHTKRLMSVQGFVDLCGWVFNVNDNAKWSQSE